MFKLLAVVTVVLSLNAFADESKHMVTFGNNVNTGWSGSAASADTDKKLGIDELTIGNGEFSVNYAYRLGSNFQIGAYISNEMSTSEAKYDAGGKIKSEENVFSVYLLGIYNFSDNFEESFYLGVGIGKENHKDETKDTTGGTTDKTESEYDVTGYMVQFGKRFNLKNLGIQNLTYSPGISYHHGTVGGDLEDSGVNSISMFTIDVVKFDLLF